MSQFIEQGLTGAVAGLVATAPMTAFMESTRCALPKTESYPLPPRRITMTAAQATGVACEMSETERQAATLAMHFGYGGVMGGVYGAVAPHSPLPPVASGMMFGLAVWTGSYLGWLPAINLHRSATEEPMRRNLLMIGAHLVWGGTMGYLMARMTDSAACRGR